MVSVWRRQLTLWRTTTIGPARPSNGARGEEAPLICVVASGKPWRAASAAMLVMGGERRARARETLPRGRGDAHRSLHPLPSAPCTLLHLFVHHHTSTDTFSALPLPALLSLTLSPFPPHRIRLPSPPHSTLDVA